MYMYMLWIHKFLDEHTNSLQEIHLASQNYSDLFSLRHKIALAITTMPVHELNDLSPSTTSNKARSIDSLTINEPVGILEAEPRYTSKLILWLNITLRMLMYGQNPTYFSRPVRRVSDIEHNLDGTKTKKWSVLPPKFYRIWIMIGTGLLIAVGVGLAIAFTTWCGERRIMRVENVDQPGELPSTSDQV